MMSTRIAAAAALFTFGLALCGATVAEPAFAETPASQTSGDKVAPHEDMTGTAGPAVGAAKEVADELAAETRGPDVVTVPVPGNATGMAHELFPNQPAPHSDHDGQGHKGSNDTVHPHR